ncbi:phage Gp37/Gp68 family protein [Thermoclostridium stercorarium]|uniref:phage Gp37/Gp68 family protein n=1 Tax=Thermoclostridium stercorarium TaxID=1510 RepID=UPI0022493807|nr:phage Gp37/Gp68 family protein [Thermoclostridium stercorarium]UZQ86013.1 phage Gp37/Gp68 family protein [Thermoclostridium stercorarium]
MAKTRIEWTEYSWNPVTGCTPISEGCQNCYARRMANRLRGRCGYPADDPFRVTLHPERLGEPLRWKEPRRVFVCSMGDLFHEDVPRWMRFEVMDIILQAKQHTFLILTKRPANMKEFFEWYYSKAGRTIETIKNLWLGVTAENQARADERIPILLQIPAAVRFVSIEPMLGPVDLTEYFSEYDYRPTYEYYREFLKMHGIESDGKPALFKSGLDWVICGGETGPKARSMHPDWVRNLRDQCQDAGTPFFFKQWGEYKPLPFSGRDDGLHTLQEYPGCKYDFVKVGKKAAGRMLDGRTWGEVPCTQSN